nr:MAG TPA: hypothetical protein [Caudoviricetes sp.]
MNYLKEQSLLLTSLSVTFTSSMILIKIIKFGKRPLNLPLLTRFNTWIARAF